MLLSTFELYSSGPHSDSGHVNPASSNLCQHHLSHLQFVTTLRRCLRHSELRHGAHTSPLRLDPFAMLVTSDTSQLPTVSDLRTMPATRSGRGPPATLAKGRERHSLLILADQSSCQQLVLLPVQLPCMV